MLNYKKEKFSIRKLSVGTASVLLGSIILGTQGLVSANEVTAIQEPATTINQASASHSTTEEALSK